MKVRCVKNNGSCFLDVGKVYEVLAEPNEYYLIKTELGRCLYLKELFEIAEEDKMDIRGKYIKLTKENEEEVLEILEKLGCKWKNGKLPTEKKVIKECFWDEGDVLKIDECAELHGYADFEIVAGTEITLNHLRFVAKDKMEEIRVVRKLEDLEGLENGMGLVIKCFKDELGEFIRVQRKVEEIEGMVIKSKDKFEFLKSMGFKFKYKPLRSLEEVLEEIEDLQHERFIYGNENYFVSLDVKRNKYEVSYNMHYKNVTCVYLKKETAQKYADELNEIIGGK